ncbi:MAG: glycosyl transferase [Crocinitomicaceae bacterium]|nr:glycosyl transferase [Crocinitomicaceae bacterium]MBK8924360.1 glycosyl transferase [Crocinitomicaceae bacterium]
MKILYAVQGTGNGHITRAIEIIPHLQRRGKVDILVSGISSDIQLPFDVKYRFKGLSFVFGKQGGIDIWRTYWKMNSVRLLREIRSLNIKKYDLIISDFEPVSCWAALRAKKVCIGLSNQAATLHPLAPRPEKSDRLGKMVIEHYAPSTFQYGFHFHSLDKNIFTPIIRKEVREIEITKKKHYTVYLPSYSDERIIENLSKFENIKWQVFSKNSKKKYKSGNITVRPIKTKPFLKSIASCRGVLCNAGFGTTSEALFLGKKLLVIPMKKQYEQHCNAAMLSSMGVTVINKLNKKFHTEIQKWLDSKKVVKVNYPDNTDEIIDTIITNHATAQAVEELPAHSSYYLFQ